MYATCLCPHTTQLPVQAVTTTHPLHRVQLSLTPAGCLTATHPRQTFKGHQSHHRQLHPSIGSEVVPESHREDDHPSHSGQPLPDGCWSPFPTFLPAESQGIPTWLTQWQRNLTCTTDHHQTRSRVSQPGFPPITGTVHLGDTSDLDGCKGALSNPESHTFGSPIIGGAGSSLPRRAGVHICLRPIQGGRQSQFRRRPPRWRRLQLLLLQ